MSWGSCHGTFHAGGQRKAAHCLETVHLRARSGAAPTRSAIYICTGPLGGASSPGARSGAPPAPTSPAETCVASSSGRLSRPRRRSGSGRSYVSGWPGDLEPGVGLGIRYAAFDDQARLTRSAAFGQRGLAWTTRASSGRSWRRQTAPHRPRDVLPVQDQSDRVGTRPRPASPAGTSGSRPLQPSTRTGNEYCWRD